jgi:NADH-quinone oxidoreductase subunit N
MTFTDLWILLPLLILACGSLLVLLSGAIVPGRYGTWLGVASCAGAALCSLQPPPVVASVALGLAATPFARFATIFFCLAAGATLLISHDYTLRKGIEGEEYPATILFAAFGMTALAAATNLLVFFLGLESLTFAFYILVAMDLNRADSAEAGVKYLLMGAVAAAFTAFGIALIYCGTGSLEIAAAMGATSAGVARNSLAVAGWGLLLAGLAFKVSLVPAHLWTPDVYQGAPTPITGFLASASKGAAIVALLLLIPRLPDPAFLRPLLWGLALLSMVVGNLAALRQDNLKRLLAYSSIAQMGYAALALLGGAGGYRAAAFYMVAYGAMTLLAFGALAVLEGDGVAAVAELRGLGYRRPLAGGLLALAMFALAGIPPTAGFTGKFLIFAAALRAGEYPLAVIGILTAAASVYYYLRVVVALYLERPAEAAPAPLPPLTSLVPLGGAALALIGLGTLPGPLISLLQRLLP